MTLDVPADIFLMLGSAKHHLSIEISFESYPHLPVGVLFEPVFFAESPNNWLNQPAPTNRSFAFFSLLGHRWATCQTAPPMNRAGNAINHPETIGPDPHAPGLATFDFFQLYECWCWWVLCFCFHKQFLNITPQKLFTRMISRNVSGDSGDHDNGDLILFPTCSSNDSMCKLHFFPL